MVGDDRASERERTGGELDRDFLLGQRLLLILLEEFGGGIDVLVRAAHAAKVRSPRSRDHPPRAPVSNRRRDAAWARGSASQVAQLRCRRTNKRQVELRDPWPTASSWVDDLPLSNC